jgi:hypothetical protein
MMLFRVLVIRLGLCFTGACARSVQIDPGLATSVTAPREMVVTAHPLATEAGVQILGMGGTAADAMIAVQQCWDWLSLNPAALVEGPFI